MSKFNEWFYGHKISEYGLKNGYVDYRTFSQAFDAVLNNNIMEQTTAAGLGEWEPINSGEYWEDSDGNIYTDYDEITEKIDILEGKQWTLLESYGETYSYNLPEAAAAEYDELQTQIDELNNLDSIYPEVYQWFIISDPGARICEEFGEILYYNSELDIYLWGVTHWGTSWDYVLTNIKCGEV